MITRLFPATLTKTTTSRFAISRQNQMGAVTDRSATIFHTRRCGIGNFIEL